MEKETPLVQLPLECLPNKQRSNNLTERSTYLQWALLSAAPFLLPYRRIFVSFDDFLGHIGVESVSMLS